MKKFISIFSAFLLLATISCSKHEVKETTAMGVLSVDMDFDQKTKALSDDELYSTAVVNIYKADFSGLVRSYNYNDIPSPLYLAADSYRVDVIAGEATSQTPQIASWDAKSYKGSKPFTIVANQTTSVEVVAYISNAISKITLDQTIAENFEPGYTVTVTLSDEQASSLVYDASKSGSEGYFIVNGLFEPSLTWTFNGTLKKDGSAFTKTGIISNVSSGKLYDMTLKYTIKDGDLSFTLLVDRTSDVVDDTIVFEPVSTGLYASQSYEIWATRATVHADVDATENAGKSVQFAYYDGSRWQTVDAEVESEGKWKADLSGLTPATLYQYKLMIDGQQVGDALEFITEAAPQLPNASFEYASKVSGQSYYKFYDPNCSAEDGRTMFWGSGNGEGSEGVNGSASMNIVITYIDTNDKVHGNQSVLAETSSMAGFLAAGNLFTGQFNGLVGTSGGKVNFGRPWTSRPKALKIWCKYKTGKIDIINNENLGVSTNDYDRAQIKVAIGTWNYKTYGGTKDSPIHVNTTKAETFVDFYTDNSTIANGDIIIHNDGYIINKAAKVSSSTDNWVEYTIPLNYHDETKTPTHIVISCAASMFGDYFTGYDGSQLWLDNFELIY